MQTTRSTGKKAPSRVTWRYVANLAAVTLVALAVAFWVVVPAIMANRSLHPVRFPVQGVSPADAGLEYEEVTLTTGDGLALAGWYIPSQNGAAVIALHAYNGNRTGVLPHAALLARHGYGVLLFDLRAHGESDGDVFAFGWDAEEEVAAALHYLHGRSEVDPGRIGILGLSIGGEMALQAAAGTEEIRAVVAEGSSSRMLAEWVLAPSPPGWILLPGRWVYDQTGAWLAGVHRPPPLQELVAHIAPRPVLFIAAGDDRPFNRAYYAAAGEPKHYWERPVPGHIDALPVEPERYEARVIPFLDQALAPSGAAR